ncbi:MAG: hypothetical protein ACRDH9_09975 [Actinomycetota bacterium]
MNITKRHLWQAPLVAVAMVIPSGDVHAANAQCGAFGHNLIGAFSEAENYGARAEIEKDKPDLCAKKSVSVAWSMVAGGVTAEDVDGWAQVGYGRFGENSGHAESGMKVFTQTSRYIDSKPKTRFFPKPTGTHLYEVDYKFSDGLFHLFVDGDHLAKTNWDPAASWTGDWSTQIFAETTHPGSDIVGTAANHATFSSIKRKLRDDSWVTVSDLALTTSPSPRYHSAWVTQPTSFDVWTDPV